MDHALYIEGCQQTFILFFLMSKAVFTGGFYYQLFPIYTTFVHSICQEREAHTKPQVPDRQFYLD